MTMQRKKECGCPRCKPQETLDREHEFYAIIDHNNLDYLQDFDMSSINIGELSRLYDGDFDKLEVYDDGA